MFIPCDFQLMNDYLASQQSWTPELPMKRSKAPRTFSKRKHSRSNSVEVIEDFSKELENLINEEQNNIDGIEDLSEFDSDLSDQELNTSEIIDKSLFDADFHSDEEDEDVGKREFVTAQISDDEDSDHDNVEETPLPSNLPPITLEEIETLKQTLIEKFNFGLVLKSIEMLSKCLESIRKNSNEQNQMEASSKQSETDPFETLIRFVLVDLVELIDRELNTNNSSESLPSNLPGWKKMASLIERILKIILQLLQTMLNSNSVLIVLGCINRWLFYLKCFPKLTNEFSIALMDIWCGVVCSNYEDERVNVASVLVLCKICQSNEPVLSNVLKGMYLRFAKSAKSITTHNVAVVNFMLNSMLELY